jgi:hypothetical protein
LRRKALKYRKIEISFLEEKKMSKICTECGTELDNIVVFCEECGAKQNMEEAQSDVQGMVPSTEKTQMQERLAQGQKIWGDISLSVNSLFQKIISK